MRFQLYIFIFFTWSIVSCDISENEVDPAQSFLKIYDTNTFNSSFTPIDLQQTSDGGYLILGASRISSSDFNGAYLMKVDENGAFVSEQNLSEQYIAPVKSLMKIEDRYYFMAMTETNWNAFLFQVNEMGEVMDTIGLNSNYPMYAANYGSEIVYSNYSNEDKEIQLSSIEIGTEAISMRGSESFSIGEGEDGEIDKIIVDHFSRIEQNLPFFAGKTNDGIYYFNGFYNFTFSLVFTDLNSDEILGQLQGNRDKSGLSSTVHLGGNQFAVSRFQDGDNYIIPDANINVFNRTATSETITGFSYPELVPDAPVVLKLLTIGERQVLLYGSNTRSGQIVLLAYSVETNELLGTKYLGFSNPYNINSLIMTDDEGLAVLASTSVAGRFDRFTLFKLSADELAEFTSQ